MSGLIYIIFFSLYLIISLVAVLFAIKKAKQRHVSCWKWGLPVGLAMYLLVFWDHIPTILAHKYYCINGAEFTVNKTLEQWKDENPGVSKTLTFENEINSKTIDSTTTYHLNQRFNSIFIRTPIFLSVSQRKYQVLDTLTNEVLASYIDFSSGGNFQNTRTITNFKFWLVNHSCEAPMKSDIQFFDFSEAAKKIREINL